MEDEKACFSSVDRDFSHDYSVTFLDSQNLQLFRQKLLRTSTVLDSCLDVIKGCEAHCRRLISANRTDIGEHCLTEITIYSRQLPYHRRDLHRIIQYSSGTSKLVCSVHIFAAFDISKFVTDSRTISPHSFLQYWITGTARHSKTAIVPLRPT